MRSRLDEMDAIRGISTLAVLLIHVSGLYVTFSTLGYISNQLVRFAVPLFIILSGFSLNYSDQTKESVPYAKFLGKRLKKIAIPYVIWTAIYLAFHYINSGKTYAWADIGRILLHGQANYHLYFIIIILQLYILYPLLRKAIVRIEKWTLILSFLVTLYYQTGIYLRAQKITIIPVPRILFETYMVFFTWIFYFVLGLFLAKHLERLMRWIRNKWLSLLWLISFGILLADSRITITFELSIRPSVMLFSVISFVFLLKVSQWIKQIAPAFEKALLWVSGQSFFIYFSHVMILSLLMKHLRQGPLNFVFSRGIGMIILYILTCGITFLLTALISNLPFSWLFGCGKMNVFKKPKKIAKSPIPDESSMI